MSSSKILEDIRILDFTHVWFGPYCTMLLAELGAEVILVEPPWGNIGRFGPGALFKGTSTSFYALNLNKKGIAVDLKSEEGKEIVITGIRHSRPAPFVKAVKIRAKSYMYRRKQDHLLLKMSFPELFPDLLVFRDNHAVDLHVPCG